MLCTPSIHESCGRGAVDHPYVTQIHPDAPLWTACVTARHIPLCRRSRWSIQPSGRSVETPCRGKQHRAVPESGSNASSKLTMPSRTTIKFLVSGRRNKVGLFQRRRCHESASSSSLPLAMAEQAGPSYVPDESGRRLAAVALAISAVALLMPAATAVAASPEPVDGCVKGVHAFGAQGTVDGKSKPSSAPLIVSA
jgi:hypothetical protein